MSAKTAEARRRHTGQIGKFDADTKRVVRPNGLNGRSQKGCFGNHVNSLSVKKEK